MAIITKRFKTYDAFQAFSLAFPRYIGSAGLTYKYELQASPNERFIRELLKVDNVYVTNDYYVGSDHTYYEVSYAGVSGVWEYAVIVMVPDADKALMLKLVMD